MTIKIIFILLMIIAALQVEGVVATTTQNYYGYNHSTFVTKVHFSQDRDNASYSLYGDVGNDVDLFVWDEWTHKWYGASSTSNNEYLSVPVHVGTDHYIFVRAYRGSGYWHVSSEDVNWGDECFKDITLYARFAPITEWQGIL